MARHSAERWRQFIGAKCIGVLLLLAACVSHFAYGAQARVDRYDYDPLGRLIRWISPEGQVTEYVYDRAGNLLEVRTGGAAVAPVVSNVDPTILRRTLPAQIVVSGSGFAGSSITVADARVDLTGVQVQPDAIRFTASAAADMPLGAVQFTIANAAGAATFSLTIFPEVPRIEVSPSPLPIAVGSAASFVVRLTNADALAHTISITSADPTVATVAPATITIAAGESSAPVTVTGIRAGVTSLTVSAPTLAPISISVFVGAPLAGTFRASSAPVGVLNGSDGGSSAPSPATGLFTSLPVGVLVPDSVVSPPTTFGASVASPPVGVLINETTTPPSTGFDAGLTSPPIGVLVPDTPSDTSAATSGVLLAPPVGVILP